MPHIIIEHSNNVGVDTAALVDALHDAAVAIDALPTGGIRTRAVARDNFKVADGHVDNGFVYVVLRIGKGRDLETQKSIGESLFKTLVEFTAPAYDNSPLSLGLEIQEIEPETRWKHSNIRDYMAQRNSESTS